MLQMRFEPDMSIEPGHQWLVIPNNPEGLALVGLLMPRRGMFKLEGDEIYIPHDHAVDRNIVDLIDHLAHARYASPSLVQLTMVETPE